MQTMNKLLNSLIIITMLVDLMLLSLFIHTQSPLQKTIYDKQFPSLVYTVFLPYNKRPDIVLSTTLTILSADFSAFTNKQKNAIESYLFIISGEPNDYYSTLFNKYDTDIINVTVKNNIAFVELSESGYKTLLKRLTDAWKCAIAKTIKNIGVKQIMFRYSKKSMVINNNVDCHYRILNLEQSQNLLCNDFNCKEQKFEARYPLINPFLNVCLPCDVIVDQ